MPRLVKRIGSFSVALEVPEGYLQDREGEAVQAARVAVLAVLKSWGAEFGAEAVVTDGLRVQPPKEENTEGHGGPW